MKDIRPVIYSVLTGDTNVSALAGTRVFPMTAPQGETNPSVIYHRITEESYYHLQGDSGLLRTRMQIDSWALRADLASQLAAAVFDVLSGFRGTVGSVEVQGIYMLAGREDFDSPTKMYRMSRDYEFWYR